MQGNIGQLGKVSIHAPHEGERQEHRSKALDSTSVSIHAPHEGERRQPRSRHNRKHKRFNPRSPRGGATPRSIAYFAIKKFQSTLPTRGSDVYTQAGGWLYPSFNPRSPRGGATAAAVGRELDVFVSIHAPHEGERPPQGIDTVRRGRVSIHAPHEGERPAGH